MDLTFGKEELAFQQEVRAWLKENLTPEIMGEIKVGRNAYMAEGAADRLAEAAREEGLAVHELAEGIRRAGLHARRRNTSSRWRWRGQGRRAPRRSAPRCARR